MGENLSVIAIMTSTPLCLVSRVPPETSILLHACPGLGIHQEHPAEEKRHHMDPHLEQQERQGCLTQLAQ